MEIEIRYTIGDKHIAQRVVMEDDMFVRLNDPYSHVGRVLGNIVENTIPAVTLAVDKVLVEEAVRRVSAKIGRDIDKLLGV